MSTSLNSVSTESSERMGSVVLESIQWSTLDHVDEIEPVNDSDFAVLEEIREVIDRHGYHNRFGVSLLHKHFDVRSGEIALEDTDEDARVSTVKVVEDDGDKSNRIGTMWRFKKGVLEPLSVTVCTQQCHYFLGHKKKHVKVAK